MSAAASNPSETATRLTALCQRLWRPEHDETEMIAAFAEIAPAVEAALTPTAFNLIYHSRHHQQFFEKHLFDCTAEYSCSEIERWQKLAILSGLGIGRHGATVALVHWVTGISTQKCADLLVLASGPMANAEQEFAEQLAELAAACPVRPASFDPKIKLSAIALLPRISRSSGALLFLCHCTDPAREPNPEVRCTAIQSLGKHTEILPFENPLSPAWLGQLWRLSLGGVDSEKILRKKNALIILNALTKALDDPSDRVFAEALNLARMVFLPSAWGSFIGHLSKESILRICEKLSKIIRIGGLRTDQVLAILKDPSLQLLHLEHGGPQAVSTHTDTATRLSEGTGKLMHALQAHIQDPESDFDESVAAITALVPMCNNPSWSKFLCDTLLTYIDQGKSIQFAQYNSKITYDEMEEFEAAVSPSFYQQFNCNGQAGCSLPREDSSHHPPTNILRDGNPPYFYVSDAYLERNCGMKSRTPHACASFPAKRCLGMLRSRYAYSSGTVSFLNNRSITIYSILSYINKFQKIPIITSLAKEHLQNLLHHPNSPHWEQDAGAENWANLREISARGVTLETVIQELETSYKKRLRAGDAGPRKRLEVLKSKSTPDRSMVKALLDAMKVLAVGDTAAQEFLVGLFGTEKTTFHWHEPTRVWIIETLAIITCGETMKSGETVYTWLSSIAGVEDSPAVNEATKKARQDIRGKNLSSANTEMLLAPLASQPADAFGLRA